jgi:hypothetical protein
MWIVDKNNRPKRTLSSQQQFARRVVRIIKQEKKLISLFLYLS